MGTRFLLTGLLHVSDDKEAAVAARTRTEHSKFSLLEVLYEKIFVETRWSKPKLHEKESTNTTYNRNMMLHRI